MDKTNLQGLAEASGWILFSCIKTANICKRDKVFQKRLTEKRMLIKSIKMSKKAAVYLGSKGYSIILKIK